MTCNLRTRPAAVLMIVAVLGCAGCERSQPGPKPISGTASSALPGAPSAPATSNTPDAPRAPASGQPR
ncbi:hypothetical protein [Cupriavidus lacunae]|uniref:hypothetical protein n=1 Tax=Cupriavidus lacunae TaxID=2666307 RepID=UPI001FC918A7|nr:hypothetical protein [Cupriavidus lacunae]